MYPARSPHAPPGEHRRTRVVFVSTYPPRHCGIATFTHDMYEALEQAAPDLDFVVCAVDRDGVDYGPEVGFVLRQDERGDYAKIAADIADAGTGVVVIEHEYGIYGGPDGAWIDRFAQVLHERGIPYLVTLHTQLSEPSASQAAAVRRLCRDAFAVTVFTKTAQLLAGAAGIALPHAVVVPHGAPTVLRAEPSALLRDPVHAREVRREVADVLIDSYDRRLLSTFGLISPGKGLETALSAVASVAEAHPDVRYVIAGATHPEVVRKDGESYRKRLGTIVDELGIEQHVTFLDFFLSDVEIALLLQRTRVFLTPYRSRDQISSGALTFALAAGCPVVSTDYPYARDMLAGGAGTVVEHDDTPAFTQAVHRMLNEPARWAAARQAARAVGDTLSWPVVARRLAAVLQGAARRVGPLAGPAGSTSPRHGPVGESRPNTAAGHRNHVVARVAATGLQRLPPTSTTA